MIRRLLLSVIIGLAGCQPAATVPAVATSTTAGNVDSAASTPAAAATASPEDPGRLSSGGEPGQTRQPVEPRGTGSVAKATSPGTSPPGGVASTPLLQFETWSRERGLDFTRVDDIRGLHRIMEVNGGGVAAFDYDQDGWSDLFYTNGCRYPVGSDGPSNQLYRNLRGERFQKVTAGAQLQETDYHFGCAVGDFDNDGFDDLFVTGYERSALWKNQGDGTFLRVSPRRSIKDPPGSERTLGDAQFGSSVAWHDLNGDGNLDLYLVNYLIEDRPPRTCPLQGSPDGFSSCPPTDFPAADDWVFLSQGNGEFTEIAESAGLTGVDGKGLGIVIADLVEDPRPEIYVANDGTPNFLFVPTKEQITAGELTCPKYSERALELGAALSYEGRAQSGMGVTAGDYDRDGWLDLYVTNFYAETNALYRNLNRQEFLDETNQTRLGPPSRSTLGFGTVFLDVDNDGWLDLFVANGHIDDFTWRAGKEPYRMPPQLFLNRRNGTFDDLSGAAGKYFEQTWLGRGVAILDLDRNGSADLAISHQIEPSVVLRNVSPAKRSSVTLHCVGGPSVSRNACGLRAQIIEARPAQIREVTGGGSFQSASARSLHFGLGDQSELSAVRMIWPDGQPQVLDPLPPGEYLVVQGSPPRRLPR